MRSPLAALLAVSLAAPLAAQTPLGENPQIREGLIVAGIAVELDRVCDDVSLRRLRGVNFLTALNGMARNMGLNQDEIDAYFDIEKERLEPVARERLAQMGAIAGDEASHCAVARTEIAGDTVIGRLLR